VRQTSDILNKIGRHLAGAGAAHSEGIDEPAKTVVDCIDNLIVPACRPTAAKR
jgi:hypothetical protein